MTDLEWETIDSAPGNFVKFGAIGDGVTGTVVNYDATSGATTFDGDPCGHIVVQDDTGTWHTVSLDKGALRDKVAAAFPEKGNTIDIRYTSDTESKSTGRTYKTFTVRIARTKSAVTTPAVVGGDEEPF